MKNKKSAGVKSALHIYIMFFLLLMGLAAAGIGFFIYAVTIERPDGIAATSAWPKQFADGFANEIILVDGLPQLKQSGFEQLHRYGLWFQLLDEKGNEVLAQNKPGDIPSSYTAADLLDMVGDSDAGEGASLFTGTFTAQDVRWSYIVGFPVNVDRVVMYLNGDRFTSGKTIINVIFGGMFFFILFAGLIYGMWAARQMAKMTKAVHEIASRAYLPLKETGAFADVYESLNQLDTEIHISDETRAGTDRMREEWIANITHDLKTPLSPIRGYAELIADAADGLETEDMQRYGRIILKNAAYAESLVNDLKLTYQLQNSILPLHKKNQNMVRFIREVVIDLLNTPDYEGRSIRFDSESGDIPSTFDPFLFKRAVDNLIANALLHNPPDTEIAVSVCENDGIHITISDNGTGMNAQEVENLFVRYCRGAAANVKTEGTGLGMAIAKQIVELHGGQIHVDSQPGIGTRVIISIPPEN